MDPFIKNTLKLINPLSLKKIQKDLRKPKKAKDYSRVVKKVSIQKEIFEGMNIYHLNSEIKNPHLRIIYFHGGGYIHELKKHNYRFCEELSIELNCPISIVEYPLLPQSSHKHTYDIVKAYYLSKFEILENVAIMGDSAGGGLALGLSEWLLENNYTIPISTILFSPWLDVTMDNPKINHFIEKDPILNVEGLKELGNRWADGTDKKNYLISPLFGNIEGLKNIIIYAGSEEIFVPDIQLFDEIAKRKQVTCRLRIYEGMFHAFSLFINLGLKEADEAFHILIHDIRSMMDNENH